MATLLEKAKTTKQKVKYTMEHYELFAAYLNGEVNMSQTCKAMGYKPNGAGMYVVAAGIREACIAGIIKIEFLFKP